MRFRGTTVALYEWRCAGHGPPHPSEEWTDTYEVVIPRRGVFTCEVAGRAVVADPTTVLFFHPGEPYRVRHALPGGDAGSVFQVASSAVTELLAGHAPRAADRRQARFPSSHTPLDGRAYLLHRLALRAASDPGATVLEVEERAALFLAEAVAQAFRWSGAPTRSVATGPGRAAAEYAARVSEVVAARYREPLSLADVARAVGCSPFHLSRLVTAATGVPIHRLILRRRLRDAVELLLETRDSISRIAFTLGFASHSHLTDAFRREYGVPPRSLRVRRNAASS